MGGESGEKSTRPKRANQDKEKQKATGGASSGGANEVNEVEALDEKSLEEVMRETPL